MAADNNLKVDELDFNGIKSNLINYLRNQDVFRDYNFDGSGMNVLLDLLAYNTYYNSFYLNMITSEAFLSTAQKRNSVVNLAKSLNYIPRSTTAASISGTITVKVTGSPTFITIPAYTGFSGSIDGTTYTFLNTDSVIVYSSDGYTGTINLVEGNLLITRYTVNSSDSQQRFLIPNYNIDTTTLTVRVLNSSSDSTSRTFVSPENLVEISSTSRVFFLEEVEDGQFEVKFGDGTFGVALDNENIVVFEYIITNGFGANDIQSLSYSSSIPGVTEITFSASSPAAGGNNRESIDSIKFNAPKAYEAQNRAITTEDYKALLLKQSSVDSVVVWGGEDNDPPYYGKVFIAVKPVVGSVLTATEKFNLINSIITPKKILTVTTEIVDPEYIYIILNTVVKYDSDSTSLSENDIKELVDTTIKNYNLSDINKFSKYFRYSKLSRLIDTSERSILSNITTMSIRKELDVQLGIGTRYEINFSNELDNTTESRTTTHPYGAGNKLASNEFSYGGYENCFLEDNAGLIRIYRISGLTNVGVQNNAGSINYTTGKIILTNFAPTAFADGGTTLKLTAIPASKDVLPLRNQIISIRDEDITVTMIDDKTINLVNR
jgi:hypothetical protein